MDSSHGCGGWSIETVRLLSDRRLFCQSKARMCYCTITAQSLLDLAKCTAALRQTSSPSSHMIFYVVSVRGPAIVACQKNPLPPAWRWLRPREPCAEPARRPPSVTGRRHISRSRHSHLQSWLRTCVEARKQSTRGYATPSSRSCSTAPPSSRLPPCKCEPSQYTW
eukprot:scaffold303992_cov30-Tisochrysis_lutea.AAC.1